MGNVAAQTMTKNGLHTPQIILENSSLVVFLSNHCPFSSCDKMATEAGTVHVWRSTENGMTSIDKLEIQMFV